MVGQDAPHHVFRQRATQLSAPYIVAEGTSNVTYRMQNEGIAKEVVTQILTKEGRIGALEAALNRVTKTNQPCRMEKVDFSDKLKVYIDVCHNISGLEAVINELKFTHPGKMIHVACAFSKMKEIQRMIQFLLSNVHSIHFIATPHFKLESINNLY